jgi:hypothetical protein
MDSKIHYLCNEDARILLVIADMIAYARDELRTMRDLQPQLIAAVDSAWMLSVLALGYDVREGAGNDSDAEARATPAVFE